MPVEHVFVGATVAESKPGKGGNKQAGDLRAKTIGNAKGAPSALGGNRSAPLSEADVSCLAFKNSLRFQC